MNEQYEVHLYDLYGRKLYRESGTMCGNSDQLHVPANNIPEGLYLLTATVGNITHVQKVTVLR